MTTKPIDVRAFAHALAHEFDSQQLPIHAMAVRCAMQTASEGVVTTRDERGRELATATAAADRLSDWLNTAQRNLRIVARALYPDDAHSASLTTEELAQQATRLHELCAHEHAENVTLTAEVARLTEERDDANARAKAAWQRADRKTGVCDSLRSEVSDLRAALALAAKANENVGDLRAVEPITQSAPLKVGDRVRLKDATVDELPSTMSDCFRVMIDGEVTPHGDNPGTIIYRSAIAGRVRA